MAGQPAAGVTGGCGCGEAVSGTRKCALASPSPPFLDFARRVLPRGSPPLSHQKHTGRAGLHSPADQGDKPAPAFLAGSLHKPRGRQDGVCRQGCLEARPGARAEDSCFLGDGGWSAAGGGAQSTGSLYEDAECTPEFSPSEGRHPPAACLKVTPGTLTPQHLPRGSPATKGWQGVGQGRGTAPGCHPLWAHAALCPRSPRLPG